MTREFRIFGVEQAALSNLEKENLSSAAIFRSNRRLAQLSPVFYQTLALAFLIIATAVITGHHGGGLAGIAAVFLLMLRSLTYGSAIQSTLQQLRSFEGFIDAVRVDYDRFVAKRQRRDDQRLPSTYAVKVDDLSFSYNREKEVLSGLTFSIPEGAAVAIVGRSSSGKTTLSQLLLGLREPPEVAPQSVSFRRRRSREWMGRVHSPSFRKSRFSSADPSDTTFPSFATLRTNGSRKPPKLHISTTRYSRCSMDTIRRSERVATPSLEDNDSAWPSHAPLSAARASSCWMSRRARSISDPKAFSGKP